MTSTNLFLNLVEELLNYIFSINFFIFLFFIFLFLQFFLFFFKDKKKLNILNESKHQIKQIKFEDLKEYPLVNIIIPAWKEGELFRENLLSIKEFNYPNIKIIVNAGGNNITINTAKSFEKQKNFIILSQEKGKGKIKAINDCLEHISKGLIYFIDADMYLTEDLFLQMIYMVINKNKNVVTSLYRPYHFLEKFDLVKYIFVNRYTFFRRKLKKEKRIFTPHTCMKYDVFKTIGKFTEQRAIDDNRSISFDLFSKGYKVYEIHKEIQSLSYPPKIFEYMNQNIRWIENSQIFNLKNNRIGFFKFFIIFLISIYLFIFPFLLFLNFYLFLFGILILFNYYLKKIRKIIFYKIHKKKNSMHFNFKLFIKLIFYIYIEALIDIIVILEIIFYRKNYLKRKNFV